MTIKRRKLTILKVKKKLSRSVEVQDIFPALQNLSETTYETEKAMSTVIEALNFIHGKFVQSHHVCV